jgi:protein-L-isoaspartate(D-aspartate) O-methyltransferase
MVLQARRRADTVNDSSPPGRRFPLRLERMVREPRSLVTRPGREPRPVSGLGLDSDGVRRGLIARLRLDTSLHPAVLDAMSHVPRHVFVDDGLVAQAYEDTSLPIGHGQTISKPSVVARMLSLLMAGDRARLDRPLGNVLEIGTGCGYQTAILMRLAQRVVSVERIQGLHDKARERLAMMRGDQVRLVYGDGMLGHPPLAPYDTIIAAACGEQIPDPWREQLAVGGRLVAPLAHGQGGLQTLCIVERDDSGYRQSTCESVQFVALKSGSV